MFLPVSVVANSFLSYELKTAPVPVVVPLNVDSAATAVVYHGGLLFQEHMVLCAIAAGTFQSISASGEHHNSQETEEIPRMLNHCKGYGLDYVCDNNNSSGQEDSEMDAEGDGGVPDFDLMCQPTLLLL